MKTLQEIIAYVEEEITMNLYDNRTALNNLISKISAGNIVAKDEMINTMTKIINSTVDRRLIDKDNLDDIIKQYHLNYFQKIYEGNNPYFDNIVNTMVLNESDSVERKLQVLIQIIFQELYGLSVIDSFSYGNITELNEINVDREDYIWLQIKGVKEYIPKLCFRDMEKFKDVVNKSVSFDSSCDFNENNPEILCQRKCGARVTATMPPYSKYYSLNIRYFNASMITSEALIKSKSSTSEVEAFISIIMKGRPNIFVIGDQGTGKTTYLLRLIGDLNNNLSILTMETMFELNIDKYYPEKSVQALKFLNIKSPNDAFQTGLRKNRDIMITGEVRSPEEADITLQGMTRQNRGSMGTFHTTSPEDFLFDYKNLLMKNGTYTNECSALYDIARAADLLIFQGIDRKTGFRYIKSITEVILDRKDYSRPFKLNKLFEYNKKLKTIEPVNKISDQLINRAFEYEFDDEDLEKLNNLYEKMHLV